jgi:hypothetical protein
MGCYGIVSIKYGKDKLNLLKIENSYILSLRHKKTATLGESCGYKISVDLNDY